tara:strand:+ start:62 stop:223 length:162 start_codon:yes stop_codon:yes gene_type:complete
MPKQDEDYQKIYLYRFMGFRVDGYYPSRLGKIYPHVKKYPGFQVPVFRLEGIA